MVRIESEIELNNLPFAIEVEEEGRRVEARASGTKLRRQESEAWEWRLSLRGVDN